MDGGAWWAAVSGVSQSRTRLKRLSSSSSSSMCYRDGTYRLQQNITGFVWMAMNIIAVFSRMFRVDELGNPTSTVIKTSLQPGATRPALRLFPPGVCVCEVLGCPPFEQGSSVLGSTGSLRRAARPGNPVMDHSGWTILAVLDAGPLDGQWCLSCLYWGHWDPKSSFLSPGSTWILYSLKPRSHSNCIADQEAALWAACDQPAAQDETSSSRGQRRWGEPASVHALPAPILELQIWPAFNFRVDWPVPECRLWSIFSFYGIF